MKRKIVIVLMFMISIFSMNSVNADISVNSSLGTGEESVACGGSICASTIKGYYGLSVKICEKSNNSCTGWKKITNKDITFKKPSSCPSVDNDSSHFNFCWKEYFKKLTSSELNKILKEVDTKYTVKNSVNRYVIAVPLVGIRLYFNPNNWGFQTNTYFKGTINEVVKALDKAGDHVKYKNGKTLSSNDANLATYYGQGFTRQAPGTCSTSHNNISCGWNVLRNYYTDFKLANGVGVYTNKVSDESNTSADSFQNDFKTSIYGKIAIDISDYVHTVRYYSNVGENSEVIIDNTYYKGDTITIKYNTFTRTGYDFIGWRVQRVETKNPTNYRWYSTGIGWRRYNKDEVSEMKLYQGGESHELKNVWFYEGLNKDKKLHDGPYTYTFYAQWKKKPNPKLIIKKVYKDSSGEFQNIISDNATFSIYANNSCTGTPLIDDIETSNGKAEVEIAPGTYYIKETKAPTGYEASGNCQAVTVGAEGITVNFENKKTCTQIIKDIENTYPKYSNMYKTKLIDLYIKNPTLNKILDFNNPTCEAKNCDEGNLNIGCLNAAQSLNGFDANDLSCFDEKINNNGKTGFCKNEFSLTNNLDITTKKYTFIGIAGQFLIKQKGTKITYFNNRSQQITKDSPFLTAQLSKRCYMIDNQDYNISLPMIDVKFGDNGGSVESLVGTSESPVTTKTDIGFLKEIKTTQNFNYNNLNKVSLEKLTGKVIGESKGSLSAYGIVSPFNTTSGSIPFEINFGETKIGGDELCKYNIVPEVITYPQDNEKGRLEIEFRIVDPTRPFNRTTNSNWCDYSVERSEQCEKNNSIVTEEIIKAPNSYGQNTQKPKYIIELKSSDIKLIKEYNQNNTYDEYNIYCDNNECYNPFIMGLKEGKIFSVEDDNLVSKGNLSTNLIINN